MYSLPCTVDAYTLSEYEITLFASEYGERFVKSHVFGRQP